MTPPTRHGGQDLRLEQHPYDGVVARTLVAELQAEYVGIYGGEDGTPVGPAQFSPPEGLFLVGFVGQEPVACGGWRRDDAVAGERAVEVKRMFVRPDRRGRGYSRRLLAGLEDTAAAAGMTYVRLETGLLQPAAVQLYRTSGYERVPDFGIYRESPHSLCFGKRLGAAKASG